MDCVDSDKQKKEINTSVSILEVELNKKKGDKTEELEAYIRHTGRLTNEINGWWWRLVAGRRGERDEMGCQYCMYGCA